MSQFFSATDKAEWASFIWYGILIFSFLVAVIWIVLDTRKRKGKKRIEKALRKAGSWVAAVSGRLWADIRWALTRPSRRRWKAEVRRARADEYRRKALMRYACPECDHRLLSMPAVLSSDQTKGTKYHCVNCGYERIDPEEPADAGEKGGD